MKNFNFKKLLPHLIAVIVFLIVAVIYCKPALQGMVLNQHDTQGWKGMAQQSFEVKEKTGKLPLWTNSMFSGMPAYQIAFEPGTHAGAGTHYISKILNLGLPEPISFFFLACLCFYILCIIAGANPWVGIMGALAYAYSTYDPVIIAAGHNTKMISLGYAPMIIAGMLLLFRKKYLVGFVLTALFASILISQNHLQVVYYILLTVAVMTIAYLVWSIRQKETAHALKASALGLAAGLLGLATCAVNIMPTYEYAKETMRGGISKLTLDKDSANKTKGGLDKDYALKWSIGNMETFTFMVPGLYGGSNGGNEHSTNAKMVEKMSELGVPEENALNTVNGYSYWGSMSSLSETTSGPVYLGAVICFLFIFGLFYIKGWQKWWIVGASILGILLAWGSNFKAFNYFMLDFLPYYSKFRAPSMAMVIPQLCFPFMAVLAVSKLVNEETDWAYAWKKLKQALIATGVVVVILAAFYFMADYTGKGDVTIKENFKQMMSQTPAGQQPAPAMVQQADETSKALMSALRDDRKGLAGKDLMRSVIFILLGAGLVWFYIKRKLSATLLSAGLIILIAIDLLSIDKRYLSYDDFKEPSEVEEAFAPSAADQQILADPDHANFRVFNPDGNWTQESITSYHHNSIGGYNPAKLGLYQDIIVHQIGKGNMQVLNMLNAKYFIRQDQSGRAMAQLNPDAFGNVWLVKGIKFVPGPNEEMLALDSTNLRDTAIIDASFKSAVTTMPQFDSSASIKVLVRENEKISYDFNAATPQFAVFSEVYYSAGWNAYIDGKLTPYAKTNYVLRGLAIPAGKHNIEFRFEPESVTKGRTITTISYILIYLLLIAAVVLYFKKKK